MERGELEVGRQYVFKDWHRRANDLSDGPCVVTVTKIKSSGLLVHIPDEIIVVGYPNELLISFDFCPAHFSREATPYEIKLALMKTIK